MNCKYDDGRLALVLDDVNLHCAARGLAHRPYSFSGGRYSISLQMSRNPNTYQTDRINRGKNCSTHQLLQEAFEHAFDPPREVSLSLGSISKGKLTLRKRHYNTLSISYIVSCIASFLYSCFSPVPSTIDTVIEGQPNILMLCSPLSTRPLQESLETLHILRLKYLIIPVYSDVSFLLPSPQCADQQKYLS